MKVPQHRLYLVLFAFMVMCCSKIVASPTNNISVAAYVPEEANLTKAEAEAITSMLNRLMSTYGCAGSGFDNRFIVVPAIRSARNEVVGIDSKVVAELDIDLFIGDGLNGTIFASTSFTVKGIGANMEKARIAALRKAPTRSGEMQDFVNLAKTRITDYYEQQGPAIIRTAQSLAQSHDYESAVSTLYAIPSTCSHFNSAQALAGEYALKYHNNLNDNAIRTAQQAWTANSTEAGAAAAMEALANVSNPTPAQSAVIDKLLKNIDAKFTLRETREYQARLTEEKNRHDERMSTISAAASVAKAYAARQPRVVYHVHSWY